MILAKFKDGRGAISKPKWIYINPDAVESLEPERESITLVRTKSFSYLVHGPIDEIATALILPDVASRLGVPLDDLVEELERRAAG